MAARGPRPPRQRVDGVLLLDKPSGISSNAALQRARRAFNVEKAGHTGTLDPLASGLLPLCFGEATKFARFLLDADKRYLATVRFGATTTTLDAEGDVVARSRVTFDRATLEGALAAFRGAIRQVPPAHSALKHKGRSHYEYARAGVDVPRAAREVHIATLALAAWNPPDATLVVECSKGTYVRSLAADLGDALGCGGHLAALRRESTGGFSPADAIPLDRLESAPAEARRGYLWPADVLLRALPAIVLSHEAATALSHGRRVPTESSALGLARAYSSSGALLGVVRADANVAEPVRLTRDATALAMPSS